VKKIYINILLVIISILAVIVFSKVITNQEVETNMGDEQNLITIEDKGISINIPINKIPEIEKFLEGAVDKEVEIRRMRGIILKTTESKSFILLSYGCGAKMCDTLLIQKQGEEIHTLQLPYGIFQDYIFSPSENHVLFVYGIDEGSINRNFIRVVHLNKMQLVESQSKEWSKEFFDEPIWPILDYKWTDNHTILIKIPDTRSPDLPLLEEWFTSEKKKTKEITIKF